MMNSGIFKTFRVSIFCLVLNVNFFAQNEATNWFFGHYAGLNFSTNPPTVLNNSALITMDGCSSISDASGNLLFYTNGVTVWDKTHQVMANGTGLLGNFTSSQSALIIKKPGSSSLYYIFTVYYYTFAYSIVDMNLAAGNGSVTIKNVLLPGGSIEQLTAAKHCNGTDVWIITQSYGFRAFHLSPAGIDTNAINTVIGNSFLKGCMKASPNGKKIASACYMGNLALYDFDNSTGVVSNQITLTNSADTNMIYDCEFSPDGSKLYAAGYNPNLVYQWNLCAGSDSASIVSSQYTMATSSSTTQLMGMQLALNGKIYVARAFRKSLGVINNPNAQGANCNYLDTSQSVAPNVCYHGLPNFQSNYFEEKPTSLSFNYDITKSCLTVTFSPPAAFSCPYSGYNLTTFSWSFGDTASGNANSSLLFVATHNFSKPGNYTVSLMASYNCSSDTYTQVVTIGPNLQFNLSPQLPICPGQSLSISASGADTYTWSNNSMSGQIVVTPTISSSFSVVGTSSALNCSSTNSLFVTVIPCTDLSNNLMDASLINISPNPNKGIIYVKVLLPTKLNLFNAQGELLYELDLSSGENIIDISRLPSTIYNLIFQTQANLYSYKLIKMD